MKLATPRATLVVGALALVLLAVAGWFLVVGPKTAALAEVHTAIEDTRAQNQVLAQQLETLRAQAEQLAETERSAEALTRLFPETADQPGLFEMVTGAAEAAGIPARDVTALTPTPPSVGGADPATGATLVPAAGDDLARQTVTLSVEGSYAQTSQLLANLEQMPRAYLITSVTLAAGSDAGAYLTTITGDMFVMPPIEAPGDLSANAP